MLYKLCAAFSFSIAIVLASNQAFAGSEVAYTKSRVSNYLNERSNFAAEHSTSNDIHFTYKFDVPWDWAHRYPPNIFTNPLVASPPAVTVGVAQPISGGDTNFTYSLDVPWDWAHRYPPGFFAGAAEAPAPALVVHAPGCRTQDVTVGSDNGKQQTMTIVRC